jgi:hypothetical protein
MRKFIVYFIFLIAHNLAVYSFPTINGCDSIDKNVILDSVTVIASNMVRKGDYLQIYPTVLQKKHSNNSIDLLSNLMIPNMIVNKDKGSATVGGLNVTMYIDGRPTDNTELKNLRSRDIENVEFHDVPTGKYANDNFAINFISRKYKYGGYIQIEGMQTIGYNHGDYNASAKYDYGRNSYSLFVNSTNYDYTGNQNETNEEFVLPSTSINRSGMIENSKYKSNSQYVQFIDQHTKDNVYFSGKYTVVSSRLPKNDIEGNYKYNNKSLSEYSIYGNNRNFSPKMNLYCKIDLPSKQFVEIGANGSYANNKYNRQYNENGENYISTGKEENFSSELSLIYEKSMRKSSLTAQLFHYYDVYESKYGGDYKLDQHFWNQSTIIFVNYMLNMNNSLVINIRPGVDITQYSLHNVLKKFKVFPRLQSNIRFKKDHSMFMWAGNIMNSYLEADMLNSAQAAMEGLMMKSGNPDLGITKSYQTYISYYYGINKFAIQSMAQYIYNTDYILPVYILNNNQIINTYSSDNIVHNLMANIGCMYRFSQNFGINANLSWSRNIITGDRKGQHSGLTGNINANLYVKDFAFSPYLSLKQVGINVSKMEHYKMPCNYGLNVTYSHRNLYAELNIVTPFNDLYIEKEMHSEHYTYNGKYYAPIYQKYCNVTISYTFDFGRKVAKDRKDVDSNINNSLLKL